MPLCRNANAGGYFVDVVLTDRPFHSVPLFFCVFLGIFEGESALERLGASQISDIILSLEILEILYTRKMCAKFMLMQIPLD